jgi:hypothetical protein
MAALITGVISVLVGVALGLVVRWILKAGGGAGGRRRPPTIADNRKRPSPLGVRATCLVDIDPAFAGIAETETDGAKADALRPEQCLL